MTLIKTSVLSAISTIIRVVAGFVSIKIIAVYIGPSGLAMLGQFQNFIAMISSFGSAGVGSGVIKYTAEHHSDEKQKSKIWSNALKLSLIFLTPVVLFIVLFAKNISLYLLHTEKYSSIFIIFAVTLIFFVINILLTSILNGQKEIKKLTIINILGSLVALAVTVYLVMMYKIYGALLAGIVSQSIILTITLTFVLKSSWFRVSMFFSAMDKKISVDLLHYSLMALVSAIGLPLMLLYLRTYIGNNIGWDEAGYWQAIWKISEIYLMLITTTLSIYYLPKLSSIVDRQELKKEILHVSKIVMPMVVLMALTIFFLKDIIISVLFSESFKPMSELFLFQLLGDVVKIASWMLAFIFVAKKMTKLFVFSEIFFKITFIVLAISLMKVYGLKGITIAFFLNYVLYFGFVYFSLRGYLNGK